ncbi:MAG: hypothetical protein J5I53_02155 [Bradyrhizobiaceae bacterium]|nr:hypothetical protein [Bradyrhizobiaceae bacterium]
MIPTVRIENGKVRLLNQSPWSCMRFDPLYSGQPITRPKIPYMLHYGVTVGYTCHNNCRVYWVLDTIAGEGYRLVTLDQFCNGQPYKRRDAPAKLSPEVVFKRCYMAYMSRQPYGLLTHNCEHLVSWVVDGEFKSRQVNNLAVIGAIALSASGVVFLSGNSK